MTEIPTAGTICPGGGIVTTFIPIPLLKPLLLNPLLPPKLLFTLNPLPLPNLLRKLLLLLLLLFPNVAENIFNLMNFDCFWYD